MKKYVLLYQKKKKKKEKRKKKKEKNEYPGIPHETGAFIDRFLVGADRPLEAGANAWVKETVGRRETMVQNAYATGLKVWVPNDEMEPSTFTALVMGAR